MPVVEKKIRIRNLYHEVVKMLHPNKLSICVLSHEIFRLCSREKKFGIQIAKMVWHTIEVYESSTIFEAKDGAYGK